MDMRRRSSSRSSVSEEEGSESEGCCGLRVIWSSVVFCGDMVRVRGVVVVVAVAGVLLLPMSGLYLELIFVCSEDVFCF